MTCNMNYNPEIDNSNRPWYKSVWERYIIPITTGALVAAITLISYPGCVKRASAPPEKKLEEPGPTKSENPDSLKKAVLDSVLFYLTKTLHDTTYAAAVREQPGLREVTYYWFGKYNEEKERIEKIADSLYIPEGVTLPETKEELLKRVGLGDIIGKWRDVRYRFMVIEPYAPYWKNQFIFPGGRLRTEVDKSILRNWWRREEAAQVDSLRRLVEHYALYVAGGHGVWHLVKRYIYIPEGAESLSIDTLHAADNMHVEPAIRSDSPDVDLHKYQIVSLKGIEPDIPTIRSLSGYKEHAKDIVDNLINPYLAEGVYSTPPSLVRGDLEFNSPIDALEGGYVELCVNERGNVEDAKIVALYGPKKNLPQAKIDKIIERARSLKFDPALDEDGNPVESRIVLPFEIKRIGQSTKDHH